jgi:hypothetical protein
MAGVLENESAEALLGMVLTAALRKDPTTGDANDAT